MNFEIRVKADIKSYFSGSSKKSRCTYFEHKILLALETCWLCFEKEDNFVIIYTKYQQSKNKLHSMAVCKVHLS